MNGGAENKLVSMYRLFDCIVTKLLIFRISFKYLDHFKENLVHLVISQNFNFEYIKNSKYRVNMCCFEEIVDGAFLY